MRARSLRLSFFILTSFHLPLLASPGNVSTASIHLSGYVPEVYAVSTKSLSGDIDLIPNAKVSQQPIGAVSFKFNQDVAGISISSSTESGAPENQNESYTFQEPFKIGIQGPCQTLDTKAIPQKGIQLNSQGIELKSILASRLKQTGIDEDCLLTANWTGGKTSQMKSGVYSMNVQVTISAH